MLDAWIIEEIKRREQEDRPRPNAPQPQIELPHEPIDPNRKPKKKEPDRGVTIVDYTL